MVFPLIISKFKLHNLSSKKTSYSTDSSFRDPRSISTSKAFRAIDLLPECNNFIAILHKPVTLTMYYITERIPSSRAGRPPTPRNNIIKGQFIHRLYGASEFIWASTFSRDSNVFFFEILAHSGLRRTGGFHRLARYMSPQVQP